jgi:hypothetical protein
MALIVDRRELSSSMIRILFIAMPRYLIPFSKSVIARLYRLEFPPLKQESRRFSPLPYGLGKGYEDEVVKVLHPRQNDASPVPGRGGAKPN